MDKRLSDTLASASLPETVSRAVHHAETLVNAQEMDAALDRLAVLLTALAQDKNPVLLTLLPGGGYLSGALLRRMIYPLQTGYVGWDQSDEQSAQLTFVGDVPQLDGRLVILLDDGLTSSRWIDTLGDSLQKAGACEGWRCSVIGRAEGESANGSFFTRSICAVAGAIDGVFGCGLDVHGYCRNLPGLYRS